MNTNNKPKWTGIYKGYEWEVENLYGENFQMSVKGFNKTINVFGRNDKLLSISIKQVLVASFGE